MTTPPLPSWPELNDFPGNQHDYWDWKAYERARADYWEARCRVAVEALRYYEPYTTHNAEYAALDALRLIGQLPESK